MTVAGKAHPAAEIDDLGLVADPAVQREFNVSAMTLWRWDRDPDLGFPPPIKIRKRKFRSRQLLDEFKSRLLDQAIEEQRRGRET
jgi:hypothetical protein